MPEIWPPASYLPYPRTNKNFIMESRNPRKLLWKEPWTEIIEVKLFWPNGIFFFFFRHGSLKSLLNVEASKNHLIGVKAQIKPGSVGVVPLPRCGEEGKGGMWRVRRGGRNCRRSSFG